LGVVRLLLALSVLVGHAGGLYGLRLENGVSAVLVAGDTAVQTFYLISGFYMALVWNTKYKHLSQAKRTFWTSRYLRLAPLYLLISLATALTLYITSGKVGLYGEGAVLHSVLAFLSNVTLIGQDLFMFFGYDTARQTFVFIPDILQGGLSAAGDNMQAGWAYLMIEQGWSIGVEVWFYCLAPFILHRSIRDLAVIALGAFALRIGVFELVGWDDDPWDYRFFPFELGVFLIGSIMAKLYMANRFILTDARVAFGLLATLLVLVVFYPLFPGGGSEKRWVLIGITALSLPTVFSATKSWKADRWIGELSYPVYIAHMLVLAWLPGTLDLDWRGVVCALVTVLLSAVLMHTIEMPVDRFRAKLTQRRAKPAAA